MFLIAVKSYLAALGGPVFWVAFMTATLYNQAVSIGELWFLGYWASQYEDPQVSKVPAL